MESILPSEVARLVYGYLSTEGCNAAALQFLETSPHLHECQKIVHEGRRFNTRFHGKNLMQILDLFTNIYSLVQDQIEKMGQSSREVGEGLLEQLGQLLEASNSFSKSNNSNKNTVLSFTVPSQDEENDKSKEGTTVRRKFLEPEVASQGRSRSSSPGTSRRAKKDDNPPDDTVDFVLLNLLDNTELHEKIAEKINKAISTPEKENSASGSDVIKTIVKETEEDPWIQGLISEIISASADNEDEDVTAADDTEKDFRESLELQKKTTEDVVEERTAVSIKQRLRSSKPKSKSNYSGVAIEREENSENDFSKLKNDKSKKQKGNNGENNNSESQLNEIDSTQVEKRACVLETALSNCNITESPELLASAVKHFSKDSSKIAGITPLKDQRDSTNINFCFVDVNETSQLSPRTSLSAEPAVPASGDTSMVIMANSHQTPNTSTTQMSSNSQIIFTPGSQNTLTLPSPLFGSGSIFTVIPPVATSTPASSKHVSAVVVSEDPLKIPNNNIFTENDISMAIPVSGTPLTWAYVPITPKPAIPDSDGVKKTKLELLTAIKTKGRSWRKGLKGSIRKSVRVPRTGENRQILPRRPPVRNLKNVPHQRLVNGVEIEVLDNVSFTHTSESGLQTIVEIVNEDLTTDEQNESLDKKHIGKGTDDTSPDNRCGSHGTPGPTINEPDDGNCSSQNVDEITETKSTIRSDKEFSNSEEVVKADENGTPGPPPRKKLSLSTPRRRSSHIRALDFNTPKKISSRKSNTSPKKIISPKKSLLNNIKRAKLFKSPTLSAKSGVDGKKEPDLVFKSPISKDNVPIATLSPAQMSLKGDWDRVNGVQIIINPQSENENCIGNKSQSNLWDTNLRALISGEYKDPSPPRKTQPKKKLSLKKKIGKKSTPVKERIKKRRRQVEEESTEQLEEGKSLEDVLPHKNVNDNSVNEIKAENRNSTAKIDIKAATLNDKSTLPSSNNNSVSEKSEFVQNDQSELNAKLANSSVSHLTHHSVLEGDKNKVPGKSRNSDNEDVLMVDEEENNVLDSSTMSESVLGLRIEENLKNIVGNEDVRTKDKNECSSSSDVLNALLGEKTGEKDNKQIDIRIESVESEKCAETVRSPSGTSDVPVGTNLKVDTDFTVPITLLSNNILNKRHDSLPVLETPVKLDFAGLVPKTPCLDTPMLKTIRENTSVLSSDLLLTPSLPATPYQDGASNSYSNLSDKTPLSKGNIEVLIQECSRMEEENVSDKTPVNENNSKHRENKINEKNDKENDESEIQSSGMSNKVLAICVNKLPGKNRRTPKKTPSPNKTLQKSQGSTQSKVKSKTRNQDSKVSKNDSKQKKKKKTPEQLIEEYLKQAKEELFGCDISSSSDDEVFEKKFRKKVNTHTVYSQVYTDESSADQTKKLTKHISPVKGKNSPNQLKETCTAKFITDSDSEEEKIDSLKDLKNSSLDEKKQRTPNKMKGVNNTSATSKNRIEVGISFNTGDLGSDSMEKLVEKSQSPKKLDSLLIEQQSTNDTKSKTLPNNVSLFTPSELPSVSQKEDSSNKSVKSPLGEKSESLNILGDLTIRKSNDNNKGFPSLHLSPGSVSDDNCDKDKATIDKMQKPEARHFPVSNHSEILTKNNQEMVSKNSESKLEGHSTSTTNTTSRNNTTIFLSKNESFTTIVFDEINCKPKPVIKIDDFDKFQVDIVVDVDEGGKEVYGTLSIQPLQFLLDIDPSKEQREECSQQNVSAHNRSLKPFERRSRDSSSNRSDKNSPRMSRSKHRDSRDRSLHRLRQTPPRTMECTRRSDGKRRIKPIRIDNYEYEARRREYERSRHERYDTRHEGSRSSSRHNRDKSRTRRDDHDSTQHHSVSSRGHERSTHNRRKSESCIKHGWGADQKVEEEDRRQKEDSETKLKCSRERTLISYDDKEREDDEEKKSITEDDLMNMAVTSGPSFLITSRRADRSKSSEEAENSPRNLPPKKRKASSDERPSDVPVKKPKTDGPQALLQKVDLDHFLSVVHGENSTASPPT